MALTNETTNSVSNCVPLTEKKERKRQQNRLNQKALRKRRNKNKVNTVVCGKKSFAVTRWRVEQGEEAHFVNSSTLTEIRRPSTPPLWLLTLDGHAPNGSAIGTQSSSSEFVVNYPLALAEHSDYSPKPSTTGDFPTLSNFPLCADHLIQLIHQNVFCALIHNKTIVARASYLTKPAEQGPNVVLPPSKDLCVGSTVIHPILECPLPQSLFPTALQSSIPHSSWVNMFPWPRFRDNLIVHEPILDTGELLFDIFGDLCGQNSNKTRSTDTIADKYEEDVHVRSRGIITWGESWDIEGWEITSGFMNKWSWLLQGCEDLVAVSNRWRAKRDEGPLKWDLGLATC